MKITELFKKIFRRKSVAAVTVVAVLGLALLGYRLTRSDNSAIRYTLAAVTKGTLITTVSGTGQVSATQQSDINPKASGNLISLNIKNGQNITAGTIIGQIDSSDAQKTVRDAEINLENAQISLQKLKQPADKYEILQSQSDLNSAKKALADLLAPPDTTTLLNAQNAVSQAQRNLDQAKTNSTKTGSDTDQTLSKAYDDGYNAVSNAFLDLPQLLKDAYSVQWTDSPNAQDNTSYYELILGTDSALITNTVNNYLKALALYNASFDSFNLSSRKDDNDAIYKLINDTLDTANALAQALQSARNMLDEIVYKDYKQYAVASLVDSLRPKMISDISTINKDISALQNVKDTIDTTNQNSPINLTQANDSITSAQEDLNSKQAALKKLQEGADQTDIDAANANIASKQNSLDKLLEGADSLDLRTQELSVQQRVNSLADARETLGDYTIKAPYDCLIAKVNVHNGDQVSPSTSIATVITKSLLAEISMNEVDVAKIKIGEKATLTFDAIEDLSITGEVTEIDTLGAVSQGVVSYSIQIAFDTQDERVKPGMSISAAIITEAKTDVLMVPNAAVKTQNGTTYVETFTNQAAAVGAANSLTVTSDVPPAQQEITVGSANDTETEITGNLKEGDQVVIRSAAANAKVTTSAAAATSQRSSSSIGGILGGSGGGRPPD
jgi:multidrug efflux pump subunit AcrA (membrane-fusion protein)